MKFSQLTLIFAIVLCSSLKLKAHQPDISSTMLIEKSPNKWLVQIRAALTAFEYEIDIKHGKNAYNSPQEFQQLVLGHITDNLNILVNNKEIFSINGYVKLGHESSVVFELDSFPPSIEKIDITNTSFANISRNKSALMIHKKGISPEQFILNAETHHQAILELTGSKFSRTDLITNNAELISDTNYKLPITLGSSALLLIICFLIYKKQ